jgi:hypothetical protein
MASRGQLRSFNHNFSSVYEEEEGSGSEIAARSRESLHNMSSSDFVVEAQEVMPSEIERRVKNTS